MYKKGDIVRINDTLWEVSEDQKGNRVWGKQESAEGLTAVCATEKAVSLVCKADNRQDINDPNDLSSMIKERIISASEPFIRLQGEGIHVRRKGSTAFYSEDGALKKTQEEYQATIIIDR